MSGITGIFHRDGQPVDRAVLHAMTEAMQRRGPDRRAVWAEGSVGFGHAALFSTLEAEREHQPTTIDHTVWITGDARIDNWEELRRELEVKGETLSEAVTDIELILRAYRVWGTACVDHLLGDFAFVIWDSREQRLVCARDHSGVKPFYYHLSDRLFVFGSEMRALLAMPDVPRRLNEARIADAMIGFLESADKVSTFYLDIERLPPAHLMVIERAGMHQRCYWSLDPTREIRLKSDQEYADAFLEVFQKAVSARVRASDRVGSMLSGGLDSSSIVAVARQRLKDSGHAPLRTFSAVTNQVDDAETDSSRAVIEQGDVQPFYVRSEEFDQYLSEFYAFDNVGDEPFDYAMTIPQVIYIEGRRQGLKALLDGVPGDNITSIGTDNITWMLREFRVLAAIRECQARERAWHEDARNLLLIHAKAAYVPEWLRRAKQRVTGRTPYSLPAIIQDSLISREFAEKVNVLERYAAYYAHVDHRFTVRQQHARWLSHALLPVAYERYDRVASWHSLEPRHPYADRRVIEFCLAIPGNQKSALGWEKGVNRRAMTPLLPRRVAWRTDNSSLGFEFSSERYRFQNTELRQLLESGAFERWERYFDRDKVQTLRKNPPALTSPDMFKILFCRTMIMWLERHQPLLNNA